MFTYIIGKFIRLWPFKLCFKKKKSNLRSIFCKKHNFANINLPWSNPEKNYFQIFFVNSNFWSNFTLSGKLNFCFCEILWKKNFNFRRFFLILGHFPPPFSLNLYTVLKKLTQYYALLILLIAKCYPTAHVY